MKKLQASLFAIGVLAVGLEGGATPPKTTEAETVREFEGGCPVPWSPTWCVAQGGDASVCAALSPLPTREGCLEAMLAVNAVTSIKAEHLAGEAKAAALAWEKARQESRARASGSPGLKAGVGYRLAPRTRACWGDITGRCPEWLAALGGGSCCREVDLTVADSAMETISCSASSSAAGATSPSWVTARYGKPALGHFIGWGQENWHRNRSVLECRFGMGLLGAAAAYDGDPRHRECYDLAASERRPRNACEEPPPPPPILCPNGKPDPGETCLTCPQDLGPCPEPGPRPATSPAEAADWLERLAGRTCSLSGADVLSRQACSLADLLLSSKALREAAGAAFLRVRSAARIMTPRAYCLELRDGSRLQLEAGGELGAVAVKEGILLEGPCQ